MKKFYVCKQVKPEYQESELSLIGYEEFFGENDIAIAIFRA